MVPTLSQSKNSQSRSSILEIRAFKSHSQAFSLRSSKHSFAAEGGSLEEATLLHVETGL